MINPADEFDAINFQNKNVNSLRILWAKFFKLDTYDNFKSFLIHCAVFLNGYYFFSKKYAMAGNRTRINCLEGSYADHYTTNASY
jgi:hypothetical protein